MDGGDGMMGHVLIFFAGVVIGAALMCLLQIG